MTGEPRRVRIAFPSRPANVLRVDWMAMAKNPLRSWYLQDMSRSLATMIAAFAVAAQASAGDEAFFREKVEPVLKERCYKCHSHEAGKMKGGLTLDSRSGWQEGGNSGVAIVPGKVNESLLITAIRHTDPDLKMPKEKLPAAEIAILEEWVKRGAPDPRVAAKESTGQSADTWWAVQPLAMPSCRRSSPRMV